MSPYSDPIAAARQQHTQKRNVLLAVLRAGAGLQAHASSESDAAPVNLAISARDALYDLQREDVPHKAELVVLLSWLLLVLDRPPRTVEHRLRVRQTADLLEQQVLLSQVGVDLLAWDKGISDGVPW